MKLFFSFLFSFFAFSGIAQNSVYVGKSLQNKPTDLKPEKDILWIVPKKHLTGVQYNRVELAIALPSNIEEKINYFLMTDDSTKGINPFLSWQLDITAKFTHEFSGTTQQLNAFYFEDFKRDTSDADFRNWDWVKQKTALPMRVRFAPPEAGEWKCIVTVRSKDTTYNMTPFTFNVERSNNPGYVEVGESKAYFKLGNETFFPTGQNLVSPRCEFCFVSPSKKLPSEDPRPAAQSLESWMLEPSVLKSFLMFQDHMKNLSATGGNYFREILFPQNQDIEWEKLGNYYGRMNRAWELDEQFFLAEELDLKIQLNVQIQFALEVGTSRTFWNWSVDPSDKRHYSAETPCANPYNTQIASTKNHDSNTFFSDETAKKFYKQKLRYIMSRWGYSTSWAVMGMASEMESCCTDAKTCVTWMKEMGSFLKNDLAINQILAPCFLGIYHDPENYEHPILEMEEYELSPLNWYSASATKYESLLRMINGFNRKFNQPFFFGELGNADLYPCDTAHIEWIRDAWFSAFSGNAGVGLNWDEPFDNTLRKQLGNINELVEGIDFDGNGEAWQSRRILSDNRKAETIFLISPGKDYAVGVISNRYYNWYLYGDTLIEKGGVAVCANRTPNDPGFDASKPAAEKGVWEREYQDSPNNYIDRISGNKSSMNEAVVFSPFESFNHQTGKNYRLRMYDLQRGSYTIEFYNALTMEFLGKTTNWGPTVRLEYPEMDIETGLIAFKLMRTPEFPQITEEERIPIDYANATYKKTNNSTAIVNNRYSIEINKETKACKIQILDNPSNTDFEVTLLDKTGKQIYKQSFKKNTYTFNMTTFSENAKQLQLTINGVVYSEFI